MKQQILILATALLFAAGTTVFAMNSKNMSEQNGIQYEMPDTNKVQKQGNMMMHNHNKMQMPQKDSSKTGMKKCSMNKEAGNSATASFQCPMKCEGDKTYDTSGKCPKCGMDMKMTEKSKMHMHKNDSVKTQKMKHDGMDHQMMNSNMDTTFQCPMKCEGDKTYDKQENCPKCNMQLKALKPKTNIRKDDKLGEKLYNKPW